MAGTRLSPTTTAKCSPSQPKQAEPQPTTSPQGCRTGKRRHQSSGSPVTARSESRSPRAKQRPVVVQTFTPSVGSAPEVTSTTHPGNRQRTESCSGSVSPSQLAVPKVSAEPPCPSKLPLPPKHWRVEEGPGQKQQCRAITECLLTHLTSSGILVTA